MIIAIVLSAGALAVLLLSFRHRQLATQAKREVLRQRLDELRS